MIMTAKFWSHAVETGIRSAAAAALAVIGTDQLISALSIDWSQVVGVAVLAAVISVLTSVVVPQPEVREMRREMRMAAKAEASKPKPGVKNVRAKKKA
jgi:hypothetical protein